PAPRQRARPQVADRVRLGQLAGAGVRGELLVRQADDLAGLDVNLEDVRGRPALALSVRQVLEPRVVDPLAVEGNGRVRDRALTAFDETFLAAVGVQQHEVAPRVHVQGE